MTREEELNEAWCKYMNKCSIEIMQALAFALRWADSHPHWISVEEEMPPMRNEDGMSDKVLTHSKGGIIYMNRYDYRGNTWGNPLAFNVTHWMPMPEAPRHIIDANKKVDRVIGTADHIKTALDVLNKKGGEK